MPSPLSNFFIKSLVNSPLHPLMGESFAVITVTGRRTGKLITTPINTVCIDGILTVVSMRNRTWWRNLRNESPAQLSHTGKRIMVRGEILETPIQVISDLEKYFAQYPGYAKFFKLHSDPEGKPDPQELKLLAGERVIIRLFPI
jgi:hypothetical protein